MKRVIERRITRPDFSTEELKITEHYGTGLTELLLLPLALTGVAVGCWVIIQVGVRLGETVKSSNIYEVKIYEKVQLER